AGPAGTPAYHPAARFRPSLCSPAALRHLLRRAGGHVDRALALAIRGDKPVATLSVNQVLPPEVAITSPAGGDAPLAEGKVEVKATARSKTEFPVTAMRLLVNGRPWKGRQGVREFRDPKPGAVEAAWVVELP